MNKGFTLLEMITVLAIIGLLVTVSYPLYLHHILKTRRSSAQVALLQLASGLEQYRSIHNTYQGATLMDAGLDPYTENKYYQIGIKTLSDASYLLETTPLGKQTEDSCGTLGLDHLGNKSVSGSARVEECWGQ